MSRGKHAPCSWHAYRHRHLTILGQFGRDPEVTSTRGLTFEGANGRLMFRGVVRLLDGVYVEIFERIDFMSGRGRDAQVFRGAYSYHIGVDGVGAVKRYDGPDPAHPEHHIHKYNFFAGDKGGTSEPIYEPDDTPTWDEVVREARLWHTENYRALHALSGVPAGGD